MFIGVDQWYRLIRMKEKDLTKDREKLALCKFALSSTSQMFTYVLGCHWCPPKWHLPIEFQNVLTFGLQRFMLQVTILVEDVK